jgi:hypothetical protein
MSRELAEKADKLYEEERHKFDLGNQNWRGRRDSNSRPPA